MEQEIIKVKEIYEEFLKIVDIAELCEKKFKKEFKVKEEEDYKNPFRLRYDFEKVINEVKESVIGRIIYTFHREYPNINLNDKHLEKFIETTINKYKNKEQGNKIYFEKIIKYFEELKSKKETLATQYLLKMSFKLIPHNLREESYNKPRELKAEEIIRGKKLILCCYNEYDTEEVRSFLKLINVILTGVNPATAEEYNCYVKHYKNRRLDIELNKKDVLKVGKILEEEATRRFVEYTKQQILNKLKWTYKNKQ